MCGTATAACALSALLCLISVQGKAASNMLRACSATFVNLHERDFFFTNMFVRAQYHSRHTFVRQGITANQALGITTYVLCHHPQIWTNHPHASVGEPEHGLCAGSARLFLPPNLTWVSFRMLIAFNKTSMQCLRMIPVAAMSRLTLSISNRFVAIASHIHRHISPIRRRQDGRTKK
jgi:hypothetical protein